MAVEVPSGLVEEVKAGNCVAFVGAGFSAAAGKPGWKRLLSHMADAGKPGRPASLRMIDDLLAQPTASSRQLEMAAQLLQDELGPERYRRRLQETIGRVEPLPPRMVRRLDRLTGIPFRAIVTTNFDPLLAGVTPSAQAYRQLLRPAAHRWWDQRFWPSVEDGRAPGPFVLKIHGAVDRHGVRDLVLTRREFRSRLHGDPSYLTALRSLFATTTILFLGYSLSDAYLDQVRGELLEAMSSDEKVPITAYALLPDPSPLERTYYARHEGIELVPYPADGDPPHEGFDAFLDQLYERTNPIHILARRLGGRRILWMDPNEDWNENGMRFLTAAVRRASEAEGLEPTDVFVRCDTVEEALRALDGETAFDLVITRWGHGVQRGPDGRARADAEALLQGLAVRRARGVPMPPVIVFATGAYADENKPASLRAGALAYTSTWETLFQTMDAVLAPGSETL